MDAATTFLRGRFTAIAGATGDIEPDEMLKLGSDVSAFDEKLERHVVDQGWFKATRQGDRWVRAGSA
jgi:hypothetical protein